MKERNECVCEIHIIKRKITYRKESLIESKSNGRERWRDKVKQKVCEEIIRGKEKVTQKRKCERELQFKNDKKMERERKMKQSRQIKKEGDSQRDREA